MLRRNRAVLLHALPALALLVSACSKAEDKTDPSVSPTPQAAASPVGSVQPAGVGLLGSSSASAAPEPSEPPPGMVLVPSGTFTMGGEGKFPAHQVTISKPFFIDKFEATVRDYKACVTAGKCTPSGVHGPDLDESDTAKFQQMCNAENEGREDHPINCIDRAQAADFCDFVGKRLPTEAEWEYAARGTDARKHPWGNEEPGCDRAVVSGCGPVPPRGGTKPVGSFLNGASPAGALDMGGNVWEWVADAWNADAYKRGDVTDPFVEPSGAYGVVRGGAWDFAASRLASSFRQRFDCQVGHVSTGVRCVKGGVDRPRPRPARRNTHAGAKDSNSGRTVRFKCPGGETPGVVRTGCVCGNAILNPCKTGGTEPVLDGDTCVFSCPPPAVNLPPPQSKQEACLQKCNEETAWRFMGQCQVACGDPIP